MSTAMSPAGSPAFYTVREAAHILRIAASTLYRLIREGEFPAVRIGCRYVIPAVTLDQIVAEVAASGGLVDTSRLMSQRRTAREVHQITGGEL
ncbi:MAG: helix-turn-helix domain-containing protein [Sciscionella sp.]